VLYRKECHSGSGIGLHALRAIRLNRLKSLENGAILFCAISILCILPPALEHGTKKKKNLVSLIFHSFFGRIS